MDTVSFSDARSAFKAVLDRVVDDSDCTIITRSMKEDVVLMSLTTYNGLIETLYLLQSPANAMHLSDSIKQFHRHDTFEHELCVS